MRRHTGKRNQPGRRGLKLVNDVKRIRQYVGKHRKSTTKNVLRGMGFGGMGAVALTMAATLPHSAVLLVILFLGMALSGVGLP